jgi:hypothetical protein
MRLLFILAIFATTTCTRTPPLAKEPFIDPSTTEAKDSMESVIDAVERIDSLRAEVRKQRAKRE